MPLLTDKKGWKRTDVRQNIGSAICLRLHNRSPMDRRLTLTSLWRRH